MNNISSKEILAAALIFDFNKLSLKIKEKVLIDNLKNDLRNYINRLMINKKVSIDLPDINLNNLTKSTGDGFLIIITNVPKLFEIVTELTKFLNNIALKYDVSYRMGIDIGILNLHYIESINDYDHFSNPVIIAERLCSAKRKDINDIIYISQTVYEIFKHLLINYNPVKMKVYDKHKQLINSYKFNILKQINQEETEIFNFIVNTEEIKNSYNIMIVEDESIIALNLKKSVEKLSINYIGEIFTANNGETGLNVFEENLGNIQLVLTDIKMPKMNGITMSKEIKSLNPSTHIIFISAFCDDEILSEISDIATLYLNKPFEISDLNSILHNVFSLFENKKNNLLKYNGDKELIELKSLYTSINDFNSNKILSDIIKHNIYNLVRTIFDNNSNELTSDSKIVYLVNELGKLNNILNNIKKKKSKFGDLKSSLEEKINSYKLLYTKFKFTSNIEIEQIINDEYLKIITYIIVQELIDNAIEASKEYGNEININIIINICDSQLIIKISNDGEQIPNEMKNKIFERGVSTKNKLGSGYGLYFIKKLVSDKNIKYEYSNKQNHFIVSLSI